MKKIFTFSCIFLALWLGKKYSSDARTEIPKTWDEAKLYSGQLPLADSSIKVSPVPADYYYRIPERITFKTYPFYLPGREPANYYSWLKTREPQVIFDPASLKTEEDWIRAGQIIFDMPGGFVPMDSMFMASLPSLLKNWQDIKTPVTKDGIIPYLSIIVNRKGSLQVGILSCSMCHSKLMPDGNLIRGAQGNYPFDRDLPLIYSYDVAQKKQPDPIPVFTKDILYLLFAAPWIKDTSQGIWGKPDDIYRNTIVKDLQACPPGVLHRHGTSLGYPVIVPDLFNIKERKYLDRTGLMLHRDITDLMRYASLNQEADFLNDYGGFVPVPRPVHPESGDTITRFSDEQLYALAKFIYSLKAPKNPDPPSIQLVTKGEKIFQSEDCITCHTPPFYSSRKLTPAMGFKPPKEHFDKYDIYDESLGTDPGLAMLTRRGTGYYKIPSLKGAWNRTGFLHSGYVATLEDMFDKRRLRNDYVPTGYKPAIVKTMAVTGHRYGLDLSEEDKKALIAFIRSLE